MDSRWLKAQLAGWTELCSNNKKKGKDELSMEHMFQTQCNSMWFLCKTHRK